MASFYDVIMTTSVTFNNYTFGNIMDIIGNFQTLVGQKLLDSTEISHFSTSAAILFDVIFRLRLTSANFGYVLLHTLCYSKTPWNDFLHFFFFWGGGGGIMPHIDPTVQLI